MAESKRERKPPRSVDKFRLDELRADLDGVNTLLDRSDLIHLPIETIQQALQRKVTIEWIFAERERKAVASAAAHRQTMEKVEERKREHERRMETDPAYRREQRRKPSFGSR